MNQWLSTLLVGSVVFGGSLAYSAEGASALRARKAFQKVEARFPGVQSYTQGGRTTSLFGRSMTTGTTAVESASRFVTDHVMVFQAAPQEIVPASRFSSETPDLQPLMYDRKTGKYKFTLVNYAQQKGGLSVFRSSLKLLVRNESDHPVVLARSSLRDVAALVIRPGDPTDLVAAKAAAAALFPDLIHFSAPETVIWAGVENQSAAPVRALRFVGDNGAFGTPFAQKRLFVANAVTGKILYQENQILDADITGNVSARATQGFTSDQCSPEVSTAMPFARTSVGATITFADANGNYVLSHSGTNQVTVLSPVRGRWFRVFNQAGPDAVLFNTVVPPGPASFLHNPSGSEFTTAEVNGYIQANVVRDFVLQFNPSYPVIATQTQFPVNVNMPGGGTCPGNAFYDGFSVNFCQSGSGFPNTGYSTVIHHEYGHHLVAVGGSGQDQYGEGMGDTVGMLISDNAGVGLGFFGPCNTPLRTADNTKQYPCSGEIHECGRLISGSIWSTRNELFVTNPVTYLDILSNLTINSIPLHRGGLITPQITLDFLTLDDDDANLENGTPHWDEICAGFGAHNMVCPNRILLKFDYPSGVPMMTVPDQALTIPVNIVSSAFTPIPGTGMLNYRIGGGAFTAVPMNELLPNQYEAMLPASSCGSLVEFFLSVDSSDGVVFDPLDGASTPYQADVALNTLPLQSEDFQVAPGWTVSGSVSSGQWEKAVPAFDSSTNAPPTDFDGSGKCFLTDNKSTGSSVSGGTTVLLSSRIDLSVPADPRIRYARWYDNAGSSDVFVAEISNDDGQSWVNLETVGPTGSQAVGGWFVQNLRVRDFVDPTSTVFVRFLASHAGGASGVEAAIDAFGVIDAGCGIVAPGAPPATEQARKNRYISFAPAADGVPANYRVELLTGPGLAGAMGWVGPPDADGLSPIVSAPLNPPRVWTEPVIHVSGCQIVPAAQYVVRSTIDDVVFSPGYVVTTIFKPADGRLWGDTVGSFDNTAQVWTASDGLVNGFDIVAVLQKFQLKSTAPHISRVDLNPQTPDGMVNGNDLLQGVNAFAGFAYPFAVPSDCP